MRIGLIGTGRIGTFHAEVLSRHPAVGSLLVTDADPERAAAVATRTGATAVTVDAMFTGGGLPDALVICSATAAHAPSSPAPPGPACQRSARSRSPWTCPARSAP